MKRFTEKLISNFYLRNIVACYAIFSVSIERKTLISSFNVLGFWMSSITFTGEYLMFLFHNLVLYEKLFRKKKYVWYVLSFAALQIVFNEVFVRNIWYLFLAEWVPETPVDRMLIYYDSTATTYIGLALYLGFKYFKEREDKLKIENLARQLELKQLKEQLNPHFLFNALNNIYSYTLDRSARANELILMLSELMRFIVENADEDTIPITQEIFFAEHYIAFEKERLGNRCIVHFSRSVTAEEVTIAPFILFTFIENAFKHGTASVEKGEIEINIRVDENQTSLYISNPIGKTTTPSTHIGLANTRRRINLLYPQRHTLSLTIENGNFISRLTIVNK